MFVILHALKKAKDDLHNAKISIQNKMTGEFIAVDLRNAENAFGGNNRKSDIG